MIRPARHHAVPLVLVAAVAASLACDGKKTVNAPDPFPGTVVQDSLVFQRSDSTVIAMGDAPLVCCGLYDPSFVNERAMRVVLYDPALQMGGWQILILLDRAMAGAMTSLPTAVVPPSKVPAVSMFATTLGGEWSSDADESSGSIVVHSFRCTATTIEVDFSADAVLGSELAGAAPIRVQGTFHGTFPAQSCM